MGQRPVPADAPRQPDWWGITAQVTPGLHTAGFATVSWNGDGEIATTEELEEACQRWAAQREVDLFERAFGRELKVEATL